MSTTCINIQPCKIETSELHNERMRMLHYVRPELSHLNESWRSDHKTLLQHFDEIAQAYLDAKGKKMHKKATPIREGVIVIDDTITMNHLKQFANACESRWGLKPLQIHIHRDEGHMKSKEWKPNLHAHIVWRWADENGVTFKLGRHDMCEMQTILSECLGMERGVSSDREHLNAIQYKVAQEEARHQELEEKQQSLSSEIEVKNKEKEEKEKELSELRQTAEKQEQELKDANEALNKALEMLGAVLGDKNIAQTEFVAIEKDIRALKATKNSLSTEVEEKRAKVDELKEEANEWSSRIERLEDHFETQKAAFHDKANEIQKKVKEDKAKLEGEVEDLNKEVSEKEHKLNSLRLKISQISPSINTQTTSAINETFSDVKKKYTKKKPIIGYIIEPEAIDELEAFTRSGFEERDKLIISLSAEKKDLEIQTLSMARESKVKLDQALQNLELFKKSIIDAMGELFQRFWIEIQLIKDVTIGLGLAVGLWMNPQTHTTQGHYSADTTNGAVLKDGKRIYLIEAEAQREKERLTQKQRRGLRL